MVKSLKKLMEAKVDFGEDGEKVRDKDKSFYSYVPVVYSVFLLGTT